MANKIDLITKYSEDAFDETYRADSRIGLLDGNTKDMVFTGAKTVKIPKWNSGGMYNYKRANGETSGNFSQGTHVGNGYGYQQSDMGYEWETFTLAVDRAVQYRVDMFDDEETAKTLVARGSTQVNKQVLIPEIDAYAFAKIAGSAGKVLTGAIGDGSNETSPVEAMNSALLWLEENEVPLENVLGYVSPRFKESLRNTSKNGLVKPLLQGEFEKNVKFTIEEYEGVKLAPVPPRRFMTNIVLDSGLYRAGTAADIGYTLGEGSNPYKVTGASEAIDFMLVAKDAVYHIVKYNKIKVFGPDVVQDYDGYKINVHVYHDVFIPDNKRIAVVIHTGGFSGSLVGNITLEATADAAGKLASVSFLPSSTMTDGKIYVSTSAIAAGAALPGSPTTIAIGDSLTASSHNYIYIANTRGVVLAVCDINLSAA